MGWLWALAALVALAALAVACGGSDRGSDPAGGVDGAAGVDRSDGVDRVDGVDGDPTGTVVVFAAASLTDVMADLGAAFEQRFAGVKVQVNAAGSSTLREQILAGAPADVFVSASESVMAEVVDAGEADGSPVVIGRNSLALAVPVDNPGEVTGLTDLSDESLLVGLCSEGVPCGAGARSLLAAAGVEPSLDTNEPDVRALLTKIGAGELDAGIVYRTDVESSDRVVEIDIDIDLDNNRESDSDIGERASAAGIAESVSVAYPMVGLVGAPNPSAGAAFGEFVRSQDGVDILVAAGFGAP